MDYRREIDGLRAIAVLPVILFHAGFEIFSGGFVGVDIFFVISGYLITTIIVAEMEQGSFSLLNFYERRARRILPALFFVMLCTLPFAWFWLLPGDMNDFSLSLISVPAFVSNISFYRQSGYFDTAAELKPLLHTWSLAVEEQYYVLFPMFLMLFWRFGKYWILILLAFIGFASISVAQWGSIAEPAAAFYLLPTRGWELLIGVFAAFYLSKVNRKEFSKILSEISGAIGLILILYSVFFYNQQTPFPGLYALVPTLGAVLIIIFATQQTLIGKFIGNNAFVGVGLISYSAYLWHQPLFAFARHRSLRDSGDFVFALLSIVAIVFGYLSWRFVEAPFRNKHIFTKKIIFSLGFIFPVFFITLGYFGHKEQGFAQRFERVLGGDIGHLEFYRYIEEKYFNCEPDVIANQASKSNDFLRCKQSKKGTPDVILLGDSHAEHLFIGLAEAVPNLNTVFYIQSGKPYVNNPEFKLIFNEILNNHKSQHIFLTMHFMGRLMGGGDLYDGFSHTIKALLSAGKKVSLISDVPKFNQDPGFCVYAVPFKNTTSSCYLSLADVERQSHIYHSILKRLSTEYGIPFINLEEAVCVESKCRMTNESSVLYRDNNHLNILGSRLVGEYIAKKSLF